MKLPEPDYQYTWAYILRCIIATILILAGFALLGYITRGTP